MANDSNSQKPPESVVVNPDSHLPKWKRFFKSWLGKFVLYSALTIFIGVAATAYIVISVEKSLPQLISVEDYMPKMVSQVYDRGGKKIGEFFRERRILVPFDKIPKDVINAFLAAEDDQFFKHSGINYLAIVRAMIANIKAGRTVQGGSTVTQQVAKTLLLQTNERNFVRKIKDVLLALKMEQHLKKEEILYLYLNQIYFGQGAYGIGLAAETYFRKSVDELSLPEIAILAGLPKAPTQNNPVVNPSRAKERQIYVLNRMAEVGYISKEQSVKAAQEPIKIFLRENYKETAPYFLETVRQLLVAKLGDDVVLDKGLKISTSLDLAMQTAAQESVISGLKELDKRQGFRGPIKNTTDPKEVGEFLLRVRNKLIQEERPERILEPNGRFADYGILDINYDLPQKGLPFYLKPGKTVEGIVSKVDDENGLVYIRAAEVEGLIDFDTMQWARKPDPTKRFDLDQIKKPSQALKMGDIVLVKLSQEKFESNRLKKHLAKLEIQMDTSKYVGFELDQNPIAEAALLSLDQDSSEIVAMVGGTNYEKSQYNRAIQAARQTGSSFKTIVYAAALDKGYNPSSILIDAPIVFDETKQDGDEGQGDEKVWRPSNHSKTFGGDITFRNALVKSLNIPTVKVVEDIGVPWAIEYSKRLGIFSQLNPDFTMALGSSSVTLYEMTKVFSEFGRLGKRIKPMIIHKVEDHSGKVLLEKITLDERFQKETTEIEKQFEEKRLAWIEQLKAQQAGQNPDGTPLSVPNNDQQNLDKKIESHIFFEDPDQLIKPTTAYLITSILKGVVEDPQGTGGRARALGREVAGKTGTTNGYYDAWFLGYTAQLSTGVWVGFDQEKTLGKGEVGGRAALPIWNEFMKAAHENLPQQTLPVPPGIVFANIDAESGQLPGPGTKRTIRQAFLEGTEPTSAARSKKEEDTDFYREDMKE